MVYLGSKNRISKELAPIIQSYITEETIGYLEPFVGGANMIDKINCKKKIGCDIHKELIALLNYSKYNYEKLTQDISYEEYCNVRDNKELYEKWYVGLVGFCCTFSAKWFQGYAKANDNRNRQREMMNNLKRQAPSFKEIEFKHLDYESIDANIRGYVIYCDIPYKGITSYNGNKGFEHDNFWEWARKMSKENIVLISEYDAPNDFECIWKKEIRVGLNNSKDNVRTKERTEKLFKIK